ncbi:NAD/NADP octopine/nopaline dehydrogenase family protein [Carboxylicivirga marina]|uniref:NAD/NADP octopine/nopaline dehydrogenase family protein n=1 Tax=Carboxylicivirga marina TaxID=2800988 RepID=UPI0025976C7F|nr:NAD/NADP octopine/nopaline dehydrogenase family protein [uncultured Carboxylicivirga sp.]
MSSIKHVCICGGGNLGHAFAATLGAQKDLVVNLLSQRPEKWHHNVVGTDEHNINVNGVLDKISNNPQDVIPHADLILVALPCFAREKLLIDIAPYISENSIIGCLPGNGNFELLAKQYLPTKSKNIGIFGSLRIPFICRIEAYGQKVQFHKKKEIQLIASSQHIYQILKVFFAEQLNILITPLNNFLELVLSNSNPILHPARLYDLFSNPKYSYNRNIPFYEEWTKHASEVLIKMDLELFSLINAIPTSLTGIKSLLVHYESHNADSLTNKIRSIKAFKGILSPMVQNGERWTADYQSRYFTEDIPYGLLLIKSLMEIYQIKSPWIDKIIFLTQSFLNLELITEDGKLGKDATRFPTFQKYGISTSRQVEDLFNLN